MSAEGLPEIGSPVFVSRLLLVKNHQGAAGH